MAYPITNNMSLDICRNTCGQAFDKVRIEILYLWEKLADKQSTTLTDLTFYRKSEINDKMIQQLYFKLILNQSCLLIKVNRISIATVII